MTRGLPGPSLGVGCRGGARGQRLPGRFAPSPRFPLSASRPPALLGCSRPSGWWPVTPALTQVPERFPAWLSKCRSTPAVPLSRSTPRRHLPSPPSSEATPLPGATQPRLCDDMASPFAPLPLAPGRGQGEGGQDPPLVVRGESDRVGGRHGLSPRPPILTPPPPRLRLLGMTAVARVGSTADGGPAQSRPVLLGKGPPERRAPARLSAWSARRVCRAVPGVRARSPRKPPAGRGVGSLTVEEGPSPETARGLGGRHAGGEGGFSGQATPALGPQSRDSGGDGGATEEKRG